MSDHIAVPVDYDEARIRVMCDFCYTETRRGETFTVPAETFQVPLIGTMSEGAWAACKTCAKIASDRDWSTMVSRVLFVKTLRGEDVPEMVAQWFGALYDELDKHITGEVRPWRAGDEGVSP